MSYIGTAPTIGNFQVCDAISVVNGQASYTMQVSGVNATPQSANHMLVSLNGILQAPNSSFTVSGSVITFASNLVTGDVIDFIQILGDVLDLGVPSDNTVSLAKLTATGTKDATTFLRGDNSFQEVPAGGITMVDQFRLTTTFQGDAVPIASNLERVDTDGFSQIGTGMTESSGVFTFPATGIYLVQFNVHFTTTQTDDSRYNRAETYVTLNNSSYSEANFTATGLPLIDSSFTSGNTHSQCIIDVTDTSNVKVKFHIDVHNSNMYVSGNTDRNETYMTFIRLGDT
jgi:hypothetical protein